MIKIKLTTAFPDWPLIRQTPGEKGIWGDCQFFINQDIEECDWWVVYEGLAQSESVVCPKEKTILITGEPPSIKAYDQEFTSQFQTVITCHEKIDAKNLVLSPQGQPWMAGMKYIKGQKKWEKEYSLGYDTLKNGSRPEKSKMMSVIFSHTKKTPGHLQRKKFVEACQEKFGNELDVYGIGEHEIRDKWDGIAPYKYHLVIENSSLPFYWTEKLADCLLAESYPLYYGCRNIHDYFPKSCLATIDINNIPESLRQIDEIIRNNTYEKNIASLSQSKQEILDRYNLFALIDGFVSRYANMEQKASRIIMKPEIKDNKAKKINAIIKKFLNI